MIYISNGATERRGGGDRCIKSVLERRRERGEIDDLHQ